MVEIQRLKPLAAGAAGAALLALGLSGLSIPDITLAVAGGVAGVTTVATMLAKRVQLRNRGGSSNGYVFLEVGVRQGVSKREATTRLKQLIAAIVSIARTSRDPVLIGYVCRRSGCSLLLSAPQEMRDMLVKLVEAVSDDRLVARLVSSPWDTRLSTSSSMEASASSMLDPGSAGIPISSFEAIETNNVQVENNEVICVGFSKSGELVRIPSEFVWRHTAVYGTTGSGKTTTTFTLVAQLARRYTVVVIDWHGEYEQLARKYGVEAEVVEPPQLPLIPSNLEVEITVDVLEDAFDLTRHQTSLLYQALRQMVKRGLPEELEDFTDNLLATIEVQQALPSRAELEIRAALERRLKSLVTGEGRRLFRVTGEFSLPNKPGLYIIRVDKILLMYLRRIYTRVYLAYSFYSIVSAKRHANTIIVLEEAHNIASSDTRTTPAILAEARKYRLGLLIVTQSPSSLHPSVLKNTNTRIIHTLKSVMDISVVARSMNLPNELKSLLPRLKVGEAIFDSPYTPEPILIRVDPEKLLECPTNISK